MVDAHELADTPFEAELNGRKLKLHCLTLKQFAAEYQSKVISQYLENVNRMVASQGLVGKEKALYLAESTAMMPRDGELEQEALNGIASLEGMARVIFFAAQKEHPELKFEEVEDLVTIQTVSEAGTLVNMVFGSNVLTLGTTADSESEGDEGN
jgi:hypothetical protein